MVGVLGWQIAIERVTIPHYQQYVSPEQFNARCVADLEAAGLREGKYVAVVGAGPSSPYIPSVGALVKRMSAACVVEQQGGQPVWDFFEEAFRKDDAEYCRVIRESLGDTPYWDARAYAHIVAMPFRSFVTFNYEDQMPCAFRNRYPDTYRELFSVYPPRPQVDLADPVDLFHKQRLVAIHGYRDKANADWPRHIVLKRSDYNFHYFSPETGFRLRAWWKEMLTRHPCLFIGTSLSEPGIERVINWLVGDQNPEFARFRHLHLKDTRPLNRQNDDGADENLYPDAVRPFGVIDQLRYDPREKFAGLLDVLAPFSNLPVEDPEPGMPAPQEITPTESPHF
jgi:hypothetical protein